MIKYIVDLCPKCKQVADYIPNPEQVYDCNCGFDGHESDLLKAVDTEKIEEDASRLAEMVKRYPSVKSLQGGD